MTYANMGPQDLVVAAYDETGAFIADVADYDDLSAKRKEFGDQELILSLPFESRLISDGYGSALANYRFTVSYWGATFFDGVCVALDDEDEEDGGTTKDDVPVNCKVECWGWLRWLLSGRLIMGTGRSRFVQTSKKPDDILRALWRANCVAGGGLIEPAEYSTPGLSDPTTGGGPYTITRSDFGPFTVAVQADTGSHPDTVTWRWDHGRSLWENSLEFCRRYNLTMSASVDSSTQTITLSVAYPATGTDRTDSVRFDRERGNLIRFGRRADRSVVSTVAECRGIRRRDNQLAGYAVHRAAQQVIGVRETSEVWRSANQTDVQNDADWIITQVGGAETVHFMKLLELENQKWGTHFDRGDKVTIYDSIRGITLTEYLTEMELSHHADSIPELNIIACIPPQNEDRKGGRSGGGHGGGHARAGGHPKNSDGETEFDSDDFKFWSERCHNDGVDTVADEPGDLDGILGEANPYVRAYTMGVDPGSGAGQREISGIIVAGTPVLIDLGWTATHKMIIRGDDGNKYELSVKTTATSADDPTFTCGSGGVTP